MTPGCRSVRSFLRAFLARGSADRLAGMSKEKMLQSEPSSCARSFSKPGSERRRLEVGQVRNTYASRAVVECPDGGVEVDLVAKRVGKRRALGHRRGDSRLEKVHRVRVEMCGGLVGVVGRAVLGKANSRNVSVCRCCKEVSPIANHKLLSRISDNCALG